MEKPRRLSLGFSYKHKKRGKKNETGTEHLCKLWKGLQW